MVPIVLGAYKEDYLDVAPPNSYINVDDFKSIEELADYLKYLDKNDTAYAAYFAWKEHGKIVVQRCYPLLVILISPCLLWLEKENNWS